MTEIIVGDMASTDRTAEIARSFGATVCDLPMTGLADSARQLISDMATQPWTLMLDADERMVPTLFARISSWTEDESLDGIQLPWKNILFGRWLRHSGYWPESHLRLYRTGRAWWTPHVHTEIQTAGKVLRAPVDPEAAIVHLNYDTLDQWFEKANRYTTHELQAPRNRDRPFRHRDVLLSPVLHFWRRYFRGLGFLDGRQGLWVAILMAVYGLQVELKRWEQAATPTDSVEETAGSSTLPTDP